MSELCSGCEVYFRDYVDVLKSREKLLKFLFAHRCFIESVQCLQCRRIIPLDPDTLTYRCNATLGYIHQKKKRRVCCAFYLSARRGTLFENASLTIEKICEFVLFWLIMPRTRQVFLQEQLNINHGTICRWSSFCRNICVAWVKKNTRPLGGDGTTVEIDVTKIWKRKHCGDNSAQTKWVVGGYERESEEVFVIQVEKQDEATLLKVIKEQILPKTTIITGCQYAFDSLKTEGYILKTVDSPESYKESENETHTNHILCFWGQVRDRVPKFGYRLGNCEGYLCEFLFKRKFADSRQRLHAFWRAAAELYVPVAAQNEYNGLRL